MKNKYRKKPVVIEAIQFETNNESDNKNMNDICIWINQGKKINDTYAWHNGTNIFIKTAELKHYDTLIFTVECGDFIIKDDKGEFYPRKPDIFHLTYDKEK